MATKKRRKKGSGVVVDFSGAAPVAGARRYDRIPEGTYHLKIAKAVAGQTSTDKPSVQVAFEVKAGPQKGATIGDLFTLPRKGTDDSIFPLQRFHGLIVRAGLKKIGGKARSDEIAEKLVGREVIAEVADDPYEGRISSKPAMYYKVGSKEAKDALKQAKARAKAQEEEEDEEEDFDEDEEAEEEDESEDEEEEEEDEEDEDLYDDDEEEEEDEEDEDED